MNEGCVSGVASARRESGNIKAKKGWKRVRERTRRSVSSVRWACQGGGSGEDESMLVFRGVVDLGVVGAVGLDFVMVRI